MSIVCVGWMLKFVNCCVGHAHRQAYKWINDNEFALYKWSNNLIFENAFSAALNNDELSKCNLWIELIGVHDLVDVVAWQCAALCMLFSFNPPSPPSLLVHTNQGYFMCRSIGPDMKNINMEFSMNRSHAKNNNICIRPIARALLRKHSLFRKTHKKKPTNRIRLSYFYK